MRDKSFEKATKRCCNSCALLPFTEIAKKRNMPFDDFLKILPDNFNSSAPFNFRVKNWQAFELGMDHLNDDDEYVHKSLETLSSQFDLVILIEYYFESLVLLAQLMCVPYEVIWQQKLRPMVYEKPDLDKNTLESFQDHFKLDYAIYEHFKAILFQKIDNFGRARMAHEIRRMETLFRECDENVKRCEFITASISDKQTNKNVKPNISFYIKQAEENYGQCPYENRFVF